MPRRLTKDAGRTARCWRINFWPGGLAELPAMVAIAERSIAVARANRW